MYAVYGGLEGNLDISTLGCVEARGAVGNALRSTLLGSCQLTPASIVTTSKYLLLNAIN